jgi:ATP-dependent DNA helicase RecQ
MVSMPTGSGKSLLFQMAPLWWAEKAPGSCVVVITPTVALAEDHERTLKGIPELKLSRAISASVIGAERRAVLDAFRRGEIPILLLSPEAAMSPEVQSVLIEAAHPPEKKYGLPARLQALFIDEAHIIESWGRSFRPDFQRLPALVEQLRKANADFRVILLSATLGPAARTELRRAYGGGAWLEMHAEVPRYEHDLVVADFEDDGLRNKTLLAAIDLVPRPTIVYTTRVEAADTIYQILREQRGYQRVELVTGNTSAAERRRIIKGWAANEFELVVATSAFGLGVDKADVRSIIHACLPETPARYYQEIGRAARDGYQGLGLCLWTTSNASKSSDEDDAFNLAAKSWLTRPVAEARWKAVLQTASKSWEGAQIRIKIDLDAAREGLAKHTGELNRGWNRTLLTLFQRAGAITIDTVSQSDDGTEAWEFLLHWLDLLDGGEGATTAWDKIFKVRNDEQDQSTAELDIYKRYMRGWNDNCLLVGVFREVEPDVWDIPLCGRCPHCRRQKISPPAKLYGRGLDQTWEQTLESEPTTVDPILIATDENYIETELESLITKLLVCGFEQFVLPDHLVVEAVRILSERFARYGFVLGVKEWLRDDWQLASLPTCIILASDGIAPNDVLRKCRQFLKEKRQKLFLVADPHLDVNGRALSQVAGLLSYDVDWLEYSGIETVEKTAGEFS